MGRRKKSEDGINAVEKKRKAVKTKRIERVHAGKVVAAYSLLEKLVKELHSHLSDAKFVMMWKKGWRPDADGILIGAKIKKATEVDKELEEFDFAIMLNYELWNETKIDDEHKTILIDHELCHAAAEVDRDGEQKKDDRGRLLWRIRKHPIQEFPEIIERYGIQKVIGISAELIEALDDEKAKEEAAAEANDAERPILKVAGDDSDKTTAPDGDAWKRKKISALKKFMTEKAFDALEGSTVHTMGDLQDQMTRGGDFWPKNIGVHGRYKTQIEDGFNKFHMQG